MTRPCADGTRATGPDRVPPLWLRMIFYGWIWLPLFYLVLFPLPRFEPLFLRLSARGELPKLTGWLMTFTRFDHLCWHLPLVLLAITSIVLNEAVVIFLRERSRGTLWAWLWMVGAILVGLAAQCLIVGLLVLTVFRLGVTV
jgi:hypothetical protein